MIFPVHSALLGAWSNINLTIEAYFLSNVYYIWQVISWYAHTGFQLYIWHITFIDWFRLLLFVNVCFCLKSGAKFLGEVMNLIMRCPWAHELIYCHIFSIEKFMGKLQSLNSSTTYLFFLFWGSKKQLLMLIFFEWSFFWIFFEWSFLSSMAAIITSHFFYYCWLANLTKWILMFGLDIGLKLI